jgi:hypothetical protein
MDSPSSGSPSPPTLPDRRALAVEARPAREARDDLMLVAGLGDPVASDYAAFVGRETRVEAVLIEGVKGRTSGGLPVRTLKPEECARPTSDNVIGRDRVDGLIVFVGPRLSSAKRRELAGLAEVARRWSIGFVGIVGSSVRSPPSPGWSSSAPATCSARIPP